jgi:hypothetical protein
MTLNVGCDSSILITKCKICHIEDPSLITVWADCETLWVVCINVGWGVVVTCLKLTRAIGAKIGWGVRDPAPITLTWNQVNSKCGRQTFGDHVSPKTSILSLAWEICCTENSTNVIHRNSIVPVVVIHVSYSKESRLVTVRASLVWYKAKTIFRKNTLKLESTRKDVICGSIVVSRKQLESVWILPVVVIGYIIRPPTTVCPCARVVVLRRSIARPTVTSIGKRSG